MYTINQGMKSQAWQRLPAQDKLLLAGNARRILNSGWTPSSEAPMPDDVKALKESSAAIILKQIDPEDAPEQLQQLLGTTLSAFKKIEFITKESGTMDFMVAASLIEALETAAFEQAIQQPAKSRGH